MVQKGLKERLAAGEDVLVAEGYLFEFERRGYLKAGGYVPEVVIEHPELVKQLHEEFVHAGSDVVEAFTYYAHLEKMRLIGREDELESINRSALRIAREVADRTGKLMAGNLSNTTIWDHNNPSTMQEAKAMFKQQVQWAVEEKADYIIAETFVQLGEALAALEAIKKYGNGLPSVITLAQYSENVMEGMSLAEACAQLEKHGADVVGLNCCSGPETILELMKPIREACKGPLACLPVPYRTKPGEDNYYKIKLPENGELAFPNHLDRFMCSTADIEKFGRGCKELGIQYVGLCCGNCSRYMRRLAESMGKQPPASKYSTDMTQHFVFGNNSRQKNIYTEELREILKN